MHVRQAITTKYLGPTNHRGSRVKARTEGGHAKTVPWDHRFGPQENHARAAMQLAYELGWRGAWHMGSTADGYVCVCLTLGSEVFRIVGDPPRIIFPQSGPPHPEA